MTIHNPAGVHEADTASGRGTVANGRPAQALSRTAGETKAFYKTSEFIVYIVATIGVLFASFLVKGADGHDDYFAADKAWMYVSILSVGYMVSRGLAKSGSRHREV